MDKLAIMNSFVHVVKSGSFSSAARVLGVSRSLVSLHIAELERTLNARLLNRTTRFIKVTEVGEAYYEFCSRTLGEIEDMDASIRVARQAPQGVVNIVAPKWIGCLSLAPALAAFGHEYPKIRIHLSLGGVMPRAYGFAENGFDLALNTTHLPDSNLIMKKLSTISYMGVASRTYGASHGLPAKPSDLKMHRCIVHVHNPEWRFTRGQNPSTVRVSPNFSSNCYLVLQNALTSGLGLAIVPAALAENGLRAGSLTTFLDDYEVAEKPLCLSFMQDRNRPKRVSCLIDFLADWFKQHPLTIGSTQGFSTSAMPIGQPA